MAAQYSNISIQIIRVFKKTYIDTPSIAAQDCHMMYKCIMNSLSLEVKTKLNLCSEEYSVGPHKSGKILIYGVQRSTPLNMDSIWFILLTIVSS